MKWVVLTNLALINTKDPKLKVFLLFIFCRSCFVVTCCLFQSSMPFYIFANSIQLGQTFGEVPLEF
jgi:hypothetical protein